MAGRSGASQPATAITTRIAPAPRTTNLQTPLFPAVAPCLPTPQLLIRDGLGREHNPCRDPPSLDVGDRLVYPGERSRLAYHARLAGAVQLEHLA